LIAHAPVAIAVMSLFHFQIAMLAVLMSELQCLGKGGRIDQTQKRTYMRSTIKKEAAVKARYPNDYKERRKQSTDNILGLGASGKREACSRIRW
jgi:hypothetical protein